MKHPQKSTGPPQQIRHATWLQGAVRSAWWKLKAAFKSSCCACGALGDGLYRTILRYNDFEALKKGGETKQLLLLMTCTTDLPSISASSNDTTNIHKQFYSIELCIFNNSVGCFHQPTPHLSAIELPSCEKPLLHRCQWTPPARFVVQVLSWLGGTDGLTRLQIHVLGMDAIWVPTKHGLFYPTWINGNPGVKLWLLSQHLKATWRSWSIQ